MPGTRRVFFLFLLLAGLFGLTLVRHPEIASFRASTPEIPAPRSCSSASAPVVENARRKPAFSGAPAGSHSGILMRNEGREDPRVRYLLRDRQVGIFFTDQGFWLSVARESQGLGVKLELAGAAPKGIEGAESAGCKVNSYAGAPDTCETGRRTYRRLTYREAWPSIDVVYEPVRNGLEYSLLVKPGAQLSNVNFSYEGVDHLSLDS